MNSKYYILLVAVLALVSMVVAYSHSQKTDAQKEQLCVDQTKLWLVASAALLTLAGSLWLHQANKSKEALGVMLVGWLLLLFLALPLDEGNLAHSSKFVYNKSALWALIPGAFLMLIPAVLVTTNVDAQHQAVLSVLYLMAWVVFGVLLAYNNGHMSKTVMAFTLPGAIMAGAGTALLWSYKMPFLQMTKTDNMIVGGSSLLALGWLLITAGSSLGFK
jgi:hypothetical protein